MNAQTNGQLADIWDMLVNPATTTTNIPEVRSHMYMLAGELLMVTVFSAIAQASQVGSEILLALTLGLWLVWTMHHTKEMDALFKKLQGDIPGSSRSTQG